MNPIDYTLSLKSSPLQEIFLLADAPFTMRLVCKRWKETIDSEAFVRYMRQRISDHIPGVKLFSLENVQKEPFKVMKSVYRSRIKNLALDKRASSFTSLLGHFREKEVELIFYMAALRELRHKMEAAVEPNILSDGVKALDLDSDTSPIEADLRWPNMPRKALKKYALEELSGRCRALFIAFQYTLIECTNSQILKIPTDLGPLKNVQTLNVEGNLLKELPKGMLICSRLKFVHLKNNCFTQFPPVLLSLKQISEIDLSGNQIEEVPSLDALQKLVLLNLDYNPVKILPDISSHPSLETLGLRGGKCSDEVSSTFFTSRKVHIWA